MTAVVVTYGHEDEIGACLDALLAQNVTGGLQVVVVDNASADGTLAAVRARRSSAVTLIANDTNTGYAAATNTGAALAKGDLLLLVNPDCVLDPGCLQSLVDHLDSSPGVGAVSALLRYPDGRPQQFCRRDLTLAMVLWDLTWRGRRWDEKHRGSRGRRHRRYAEQFENPPPGPFEVDCPAAACVLVWHPLVRHQVMRSDLPLFFNDGDLYDRLRAKSYRVHVLPAATARHGYSTSLQRLPDARKRAEFVVGLRRWAHRWWPLRRRAALWCLLLADAVCSRGYHRRGTLGGLGLPGGAMPWLSVVPGPRTRLKLALLAAREAGHAWWDASRRRTRRRVALRRIHRSARQTRGSIDVRIDRTADVAPDLVVEVRRGQTGVLRLGRRTLVQSGVVIRLWGGELVVGDGTQIRYGAVLTVKGRMELHERVTISRGTNVHADGTLVMEFGVGIAEGATIVDNSHRLGTLLPVFDLPVQQRDVRIGAGTFVGANAVVTSGVQVGRRAVVGANSVVVRDVPDGAFVTGIPAKARSNGRGRTP